MTTMMKYIPMLITASALIYGGIVDFRRREIPNIVPVTLLFMGIFGISMFWSIMGLIVPAVLLLLAAKLTKSEIPGGDFKLICSLGFACGLWELTAIIFLAGIGAVLYGLVRRMPIKRHIPLCSYIAPAYIGLQIIAIMT